MRRTRRALFRALPAPLQSGVAYGYNRVQRAFGLSQLKAARARRTLSPGPLVIVGLHSAVLGIGQGARLMSEALFALFGGRVRTVDVSPLFFPQLSGAGACLEALQDQADSGVVLCHLNPPELEELVARTRGRFLGDRWLVGYWAWELERTPARWSVAAGLVDEIWTPSRFTQDAVRAIAGPTPVRVTPHPLPDMRHIRPARGEFGLPADRLAVLCACDARSSLARKNPIGAIKAFKDAFPDAAEAVLIVKLVGLETFPGAEAAIAEAIGSRPDIRIMTETLSAQAMLRLVASIDVVLSPHRAEGFGLLLAEAAALEKLIIATDWSGSTDFLEASGTVLLPYTLTAISDPQGVYRSGRWAEPHLAPASAALRRAAVDPLWRRTMGAAAAQTAAERLSIPAIERALSPATRALVR
jgi:glycosyltransferase involved in cell wall biosynthesis